MMREKENIGIILICHSFLSSSWPMVVNIKKSILEPNFTKSERKVHFENYSNLVKNIYPLFLTAKFFY